MSSMRKLRATLAALLVGLLGLEVAVRLGLRDEWDAPVIQARQAGANFMPLVRFSADPALYYEVVPNLDLDFHGVRVRTDADGCRVPAQPPVHAPACDPAAPPLRVAVVGPSTTFGYRLPCEQSYPELLRPRLEALARRPVELRNFSAPAYNSEQEARLFELRALPWRPELVLWHYDHRDAFPALGPDDRIELSPYFGDNPLHWATLKLLRRRLRLAELESLRLGAEGHGFAEGYIVSGPSWDRHLQALQRVADQARSLGAPVFVVIFDAFVQRGDPGLEHAQALHRPLVPALEAAGLHVIDLYPDYEAVMEQRGWKDLRRWWFSVAPLDGHPNAEGHTFIADRVAAWMESHPELIPGATESR
jgi:hypothetical protein